jgi:hypothetical protein
LPDKITLTVQTPKKFKQPQVSKAFLLSRNRL